MLVAYVHANTAQLAAWTPGGSAVPLADLLGASGSSLRVRSVALRRQGSCGVAFAVQGDEESEPGLRFGIYDACTLTFALPGAPPGTLGGTSTPVIALSRDGEHSRAFAPLADRSLYAIAFEPTEVLARISELPAVPALVLGTVVPRALVDTPGDAVHWFDTASTGADVIMTDERTAGTSPIFATVDENVDIVGWAYRSGIDDVVRLRALGASCASPLGDRTFLGPPGPMAAASMPGGGAVVAMAHAADGVVLRFVDRHLGDVRASETEATLGLPFAADGAAVDRTLAVDAWDDADFVYVAVAARVVESGTVTIRAAFLSIPKCGLP